MPLFSAWFPIHHLDSLAEFVRFSVVAGSSAMEEGTRPWTVGITRQTALVGIFR